MTLRSRLTAAFVLVVLVPLLVVVALVTRALPAALANGQEQSLVPSGRLAAEVVGQLCRRARAAAEAAGRAASEPAGLERGLQDLVRGELADGVEVLDSSGGVVASAGRVPAPVTGGDCVTGKVLRSGDAVHIAAVVRLARPTGDVGSAVASFVVDDELAAWLRETVGTGMVVLLADGEPVARSGPVDPALVRAAQASGERPARDETDLAVVVREQDYQPVAVLLAVPVEEGVTLLPYLALVVAAVALAAGIARLLARATTRPLEELGDATERVAGGDLSTAIEVRSGDEVGRLATTFNAMTDDLRSYVVALQTSRDELQAGVARLGATLASTHDLDRILTVVLDTAMASTGAGAGAVLLLSSDGSALELTVSKGLPDEAAHRLPLGEGVAGTVASTGQALRGRTGPDLQPAPGEPTGATVIAVPLASSTTVIGVLLLLDRADGEVFDDRDLATLQTFTNQATVAVDNVLLHDEARRLSVTDALTGLWNYRYFQLTISKEIERASRFDRPLALLMLDLDHFKQVNDLYGHQRGDAVLIELAERLRTLVRDVDTLARYGGEELVVVLPETDEPGAARTAERICQAVRAKPFGRPGDPPVTVTVSVGVAVFPGHGEASPWLLRAADEALYLAKREGRDGWRLAPTPAAAPAP